MVRVRPILRSTLHDELVQQLRALIVQDQLTPGAKINEKALCDAFGVSRTPLREALKVLASEGLVTLLPNRGATVTETSQKDIEDILPILKALEELAGRLACTNMSDEQIARVAELQTQMEAHFERGEMSEYLQVNQAIHDAILEGSENYPLISTYKALAGRIRRMGLASSLVRERAQQAINEHRLILGALQDRDSQRLIALLAEHMLSRVNAIRTPAKAEDA